MKQFNKYLKYLVMLLAISLIGNFIQYNKNSELLNDYIKESNIVTNLRAKENVVNYEKMQNELVIAKDEISELQEKLNQAIEENVILANELNKVAE